MVGIGETGLDYHYTAESAAAQQESLRVHIAAARQTGLPLIIHARDADDDMARILTEEHRAGAYDCVMHCFSSGAALAEAALDLGFYLSMSGITAFPKSGDLRAIFAAAPLDRILVETDAPYLAPPPHRGKRNEPGFVAHTARAAAQTFGLDYAEFASPDRGQFRPFVPKGRSMDRLTFTILGCGSSGGVPRIGGHWGDCDPSNPKNRRRRCSLLVEREGDKGSTRVLIDTSPDLRMQLLDAGIGVLDAVVYTHDHADHVHGIDDLRPIVFNTRERLNVWADRRDAGRPLLPLRLCLCPAGRLALSADPEPAHDRRRRDGRTARAARSRLPRSKSGHGSIDALGFRIRDLAYLPDVAEHVSSGMGGGGGSRLLDRRCPAPHPASDPRASGTHAGMDRTRRARRAVLTNMHIDLDYETVLHETPDHVVPAYDGMTIVSRSLARRAGSSRRHHPGLSGHRFRLCRRLDTAFSDAGVDGLMKFTQNFAIPCLLFDAIANLDLSAHFDLALLGSFYTGATIGFLAGLRGRALSVRPQSGRQHCHRFLLPVLQQPASGPARSPNAPTESTRSRRTSRSSRSMHRSATGWASR